MNMNIIEHDIKIKLVSENPKPIQFEIGLDYRLDFKVVIHLIDRLTLKQKIS